MSGLAASRLPNPTPYFFPFIFLSFIGRGRYDFSDALVQRLEFTLPPDVSILIPKLIYIICLHTYLLDSPVSQHSQISCNNTIHSMAWNGTDYNNTCLSSYCKPKVCLHTTDHLYKLGLCNHNSRYQWSIAMNTSTWKMLQNYLAFHMQELNFIMEYAYQMKHTWYTMGNSTFIKNPNVLVHAKNLVHTYLMIELF